MEGMLQLAPKDELIQKYGKFYAEKGKKRPRHDDAEDDGNPAYERFTQDGLLLERHGDDGLRLISYTGPETDVSIPDEVTSIAPYAFDGACGIQRLRFLHGIEDVGIRAFTIGERIDVIRIDLPEPIDGHDFFEIRFPDTARGKRQQYVALTAPDALDPANLYANYDVTITNSSIQGGASSEDSLDPYDQHKAMVERLKDPVFMTPANRQMIEHALENRLVEACTAFSAHGDKAALNDLADLGFLNEQNIASVIDRVGAVKDAAMTAHLLEIRHRWFEFNDDVLDFSL